MGAAQSLGAAAGSLIGGTLYARRGASAMWLTMAAVALGTGIIYSLVPMRDLEHRRQRDLKVAAERAEMLEVDAKEKIGA